MRLPEEHPEKILGGITEHQIVRKHLRCAVQPGRLMRQQRSRVPPLNEFARSARGDAVKAELVRQMLEARAAEEVQDAWGIVFVPVFAEKARREAAIIPGFDQQEAAAARQFGGFAQRAAGRDEVGDHLNHRDEIVVLRGLEVFEVGVVEGQVEHGAAILRHALVGLKCFRAPAFGTKTIADESGGGSDIEHAAGCNEGTQFPCIVFAVRMQQRGAA